MRPSRRRARSPGRGRDSRGSSRGTHHGPNVRLPTQPRPIPTTRPQGPPYNTIQHPDPSPFSKVNSAARVAASNTSSTPSPLRLEHSRYLLAEISRATASPSWPETKRSDFLRCSSTATGSSRRSFFRPTRMMGTFGQRRAASVIHCCVSAADPSFFLSFLLRCWDGGLALCYRSGPRERCVEGGE